MTLRRAPLCLLLGLALAASLGVVVACSSDPIGIDACRQIETARCESANSCGIDLSQPVHRGDSPNLDVGACKRFYDDACLHGFVTTVDPGSVKVAACVAVLTDPTTSCDIIKSPETSPACSFLIPPVDADAQADTSTE